MADNLVTGAGACVQILLFSVAAIELKRKAPGAHTFLERTLTLIFCFEILKTYPDSDKECATRLCRSSQKADIFIKSDMVSLVIGYRYSTRPLFKYSTR